MKRIFLAVVISTLFIVGDVSAFTIKDGEGNKVKISPLGVKVSTSSGEEVSVSSLGVKAKDGDGTEVKVSASGVSITADEEGVTKTGILLANEHKIVVEARRSAMNFNEINASKAIRVVVEERTTGNIIIRAPRSVMPYVSLSVKDDTLYATLLSGAPVSRNSNIVAEVYVPYNGRINEISTRSAARVIVKPTIACGELDLDASSASVIEVKAGVKECSIEASGASTIKAELTTTELDIEMSGASVISLSGQAADTDIEMSGASTLKAKNLRNSKLDIECSGASKAEASAVVCSAKTSGASDVVVECSSQLNASATGGSSIVYSGDCRVNILSNSGASSIRKK